MVMVKINGILVNEDAITSIVIAEEEQTAYVFLNEVRGGNAVCLHVHGKDAVGYLEAHFGMRVVAVFENDDEEEEEDEEETRERVRLVD